MSQASDDERGMRAEYDIRGGVRGKYFARYSEGAKITITFEESRLIAMSTASTPPVGTITKLPVYPLAYPSPKIQMGVTTINAPGR